MGDHDDPAPPQHHGAVVATLGGSRKGAGAQVGVGRQQMEEPAVEGQGHCVLAAGDLLPPQHG